MKKQIEGQLDFFNLLTETKLINELPQFVECNNCWCYDCKHNENNNAIPRDFAGIKKPCPSCSYCMKSGKAEICEIGSYENGCKLRAEEEGVQAATAD